MANNITRDYFLLVFDEFQGVPSPKIDALIGVASLRVAPLIWMDHTQYATALLTAHMISAGGGAGGEGGGVSGPVQSETVSALSRSYGTVGSGESGDQELLTTRYGQEFVSLRREVVVGATVLGSTLRVPSGQTVW